jgi:hypothetical protein
MLSRCKDCLLEAPMWMRKGLRLCQYIGTLVVLAPLFAFFPLAFASRFVIETHYIAYTCGDAAHRLFIDSDSTYGCNH